MRRHVTAAVAVVTILVTWSAVGCSPPKPDEESYLEQVGEYRDAKNLAFSAPDSIVPIDRQSWMVPLHYYEPSLDYRVPAQLNIGDEQPVSEIPTSTGQLRMMQRVGTLEFMLHGQPMTLSALVELPVANADHLFVPFRDTTSGTETYPAGRYLDLPNTPTGIYDLDFNHAYHPNCYFNEEYDCPFPPPENRLAVAVRAGERMPPAADQRIPLGTIDGPPITNASGHPSSEE